jgi:hypothetical protein
MTCSTLCVGNWLSVTVNDWLLPALLKEVKTREYLFLNHTGFYTCAAST